METRVVRVPGEGPPGCFADTKGLAKLEQWRVQPGAEALKVLEPAAKHLRTRDTPVAFPTETVYGLGADATRSASVRGIYAAKGRPLDNPLIIHIADLAMLRSLLGGDDAGEDVIPAKYRPLIERFWPGPLTILLPNPEPSPLAPEVTAGLKTFGVRMPSSPLALTLIKLAGVPLAAPSANASTRPSPTMAQHVKDDLDGRIELVLDGGASQVGVESTVVDGLCDPPVVLRPGGVSMEEIRSCPGWNNVSKAYKDVTEEGKAAPRAPGMKYKHYSPRAKVVLYESSYRPGSGDGVVATDIDMACAATKDSTRQTNGCASRRIGVIRTRNWKPAAGFHSDELRSISRQSDGQNGIQRLETSYDILQGDLKSRHGSVIGQIFDIALGTDTRVIAQGLFSALRELDRRGADTIFVEGIDDELDIAAAVMNRLRKAASEVRT
ncbi:translation initiation protein Sua5 [Drechmeria coniospora]|uniref:Threonylcarbamoyl-AMP synthase n=1 Tax=Drechmeria coniospora TaxID=98403 RepID=A0A151GKS3_DRECN|nr:translation initiation protein Sua5 [Drechmeria coniospora]KYK57700.1 translation initiation protein Sua5 [Drechmeria coniospora]ODA79590.1 hypothetical protein RJ55_05184 [Drechmeria coniospora]